MGSQPTEGPVYFCEDVSRIEEVDGIFYLTDECGDFRIRRAMRPSVFLRCVRGASKVADAWERRKGENVRPMRGTDHAASS